MPRSAPLGAAQGAELGASLAMVGRAVVDPVMVGLEFVGMGLVMMRGGKGRGRKREQTAQKEEGLHKEKDGTKVGRLSPEF